jgi:DNA-binding GntR family transcriptional regulator
MNTLKKAGNKKPLVDQAYELLKEKMVSLELAPGMKLEEQYLMDMLKLRQIINSLGAVAFDLANPHNDFSGIVKKLESFHQMMEESMRKGDIQTYVKLNAEFHKTLAKVADNEFLDDALEKIYFFETRQAFVVSLSLGDKKGSKFTQFYQAIQKQHRKFIDYLEKKDFEKMKEVYKEHMATAQERLNAYFAGHNQ